MDILFEFASKHLHHDALRNLFYAPVSFFTRSSVYFTIIVNSSDTDYF